jgi:hypothetical protein
MVANPKPGNGIIVKESKYPVAEGHFDRPNILVFIDAFETQ